MVWNASEFMSGWCRFLPMWRWGGALVFASVSVSACWVVACGGLSSSNDVGARQDSVAYEARPYLRFRGPTGLRQARSALIEGIGSEFENERFRLYFVLDRYRDGDPPLSDLPAAFGPVEPPPRLTTLNGLPAWLYRVKHSAGGFAEVEFRDLADRGYSPDARLRIGIVTTDDETFSTIDATVGSIEIQPGKPFDDRFMRPPLVKRQ